MFQKSEICTVEFNAKFEVINNGCSVWFLTKLSIFIQKNAALTIMVSAYTFIFLPNQIPIIIIIIII